MNLILPTKITIETSDRKLITHLLNCSDRQTNFRLHTRQFKVVGSHGRNAVRYTFLLQEVIPQTK
jgi:hypothetical protein